jgi:hypothetical protein
MRGAAVVALLLAALCVASAARIPDDDLSNIKETLSSVGSVQVGAADVPAVWLLFKSSAAVVPALWSMCIVSRTLVFRVDRLLQVSAQQLVLMAVKSGHMHATCIAQRSRSDLGLGVQSASSCGRRF